jgi:hypothetical protein
MCVTNGIPLGCSPFLTGWHCKFRHNTEGACRWWPIHSLSSAAGGSVGGAASWVQGGATYSSGANPLQPRRQHGTVLFPLQQPASLSNQPSSPKASTWYGAHFPTEMCALKDAIELHAFALRLKLLRTCGQWHSSRVFTTSYRFAL